ncbi:MAG: pyruvate/oxaloacetate carboxyltransferase [Alphaproteobacteria bacterium]|jgi:pyruvate/oxaloacetate carboxyltransferase
MKNNTQNINTYIENCTSRLSLNIIRDGTQSAEGNRLRHSDILDIVAKIDAYMQILPKNALAVCESWGGASVSEPVRLNGEDSFENLENILKIATHTPHSCLYRGTQGFGYLPLSQADQKLILDAVCTMGIKHFRIFDMMNDAVNIKTSVYILHDFKQNIRIELAICANSEADKDKKLRTEAYYQKIIADYLALKPHQMAIKDYSGLCNFEEIKQIIDLIRAQNASIPIAVHSHTEKSDILAHLLLSGADTVDVGMSAWSGGNAHSDYFKTLYAYLELSGFNVQDSEIIKAIESHPIILKAREIEALCDLIAPPYKAIRLPSHKQPHKETLYKAKIAAGGIVAMRDMLRNNLKAAQAYLSKLDKNPPSEEHLMDAALHKMAVLWEDAGRSDMVTPGSLILSKAANILTFQEIVYQKPITLKDIPQDYKDLVMGRYGKNWGFEAGFGHLPMRHLFFLESGISVLKAYCRQNDVVKAHYQNFIQTYKIPDLYDLQNMIITEALEKASDWLNLVTKWLEGLSAAVSDVLLKHFTDFLFPEPKSLYPQAKQGAQNLILSGAIDHAYSGYADKTWLEKRLVFLLMAVKSDHVIRMVKFKSDGIVTGTIEVDPRAIFWRDTICAGNVRESYQDLVDLMQFYPPGRMTRSNPALRARKRRTLSLKMTEIGIENNFQTRSDINNIYYVHRLIAKNIVVAKRRLSDALNHCVAPHPHYYFYKSKIIAAVMKQAMLDAINMSAYHE